MAQTHWGMSAVEIADWEASLFEDGIRPRVVVDPKADGAVVRYDAALKAGWNARLRVSSTS